MYHNSQHAVIIKFYQQDHSFTERKKMGTLCITRHIFEGASQPKIVLRKIQERKTMSEICESRFRIFQVRYEVETRTRLALRSFVRSGRDPFWISIYPRLFPKIYIFDQNVTSSRPVFTENRVLLGIGQILNQRHFSTVAILYT